MCASVAAQPGLSVFCERAGNAVECSSLDIYQMRLNYTKSIFLRWHPVLSIARIRSLTAFRQHVYELLINQAIAMNRSGGRFFVTILFHFASLTFVGPKDQSR